MANIESIVQQLRQERDRLDAAIRALTSVGGGTGQSTASTGATPKRRTLSAAARRKIAAAQRARWAKVKAKQK
jgi:hypothetical protein